MQRKELIFLLIILLIASFFRLWQLNKIPPSLYPDEAINGNEAISTPGKVFYPENNGREGLFINLVALNFSIFSISILSLRLVSATIGILTILGLYLLTKELFSQSTIYKLQTTNIALLSSFFLAISFWHTNFSRIAFRGILLPFILVFSFYFLLKGFKNLKIRDFIISGIFFGLGFYTYISFRFAVLILPFIFIPFWFIHRQKNQTKKSLLSTFYFLLSTFIVAFPIGIYFLQNPKDFIGRAAPISVFAAENPIKEFIKSLILHLGMFNFYGDPNWRHNFSESPQLFWPIGILFLIGIIFSFKKCLLSTKNKNWLPTTGHWLLLSWFFIMLLPGVLTREGLPHSLRVIGTIPVVYIFVGFGGWKVYQFFYQNIKRKKLLLFSCFLFLFATFLFQSNKYFLKWGKNPEVEGAFTKRFVEIGYYLNSLPENIQKYVIVNEGGVPVPWPNGIPMPAQTVMFIQETKGKRQETKYLLPENLNEVKINNKETVIILMRYDEDLFNKLSQKFPQGEIKKWGEIVFYEIN